MADESNAQSKNGFIYINLGSEKFKVPAQPSDTIGMLTSKIREMITGATWINRLILNSYILEDGRTLSDCNILMKSTLKLQLIEDIGVLTF